MSAKPNGKLRSGQIRILKVLAKGHTYPRAKLAKLAKVGIGWAFWFTGPTNPKKRAASEKASGFPSLLSLGLIDVVTVGGGKATKSTASGKMIPPEPVERLYTITPAGRKAIP